MAGETKKRRAGGALSGLAGLMDVDSPCPLWIQYWLQNASPQPTSSKQMIERAEPGGGGTSAISKVDESLNSPFSQPTDFFMKQDRT